MRSISVDVRDGEEAELYKKETPMKERNVTPQSFEEKNLRLTKVAKDFQQLLLVGGHKSRGWGLLLGGGRFAVGSLKSGILQQCLRVCSSKHWQLKISQKCHKMLAQTFPGVELVFFFFPLPISPPPPALFLYALRPAYLRFYRFYTSLLFGSWRVQKPS